MELRMKFNYKHKSTGETKIKLFTMNEVEGGQSRLYTVEMESKGYGLERVILDEQKEEKENGNG